MRVNTESMKHVYPHTKSLRKSWNYLYYELCMYEWYFCIKYTQKMESFSLKFYATIADQTNTTQTRKP